MSELFATGCLEADVFSAVGLFVTSALVAESAGLFCGGFATGCCSAFGTFEGVGWALEDGAAGVLLSAAVAGGGGGTSCELLVFPARHAMYPSARIMIAKTAPM